MTQSIIEENKQVTQDQLAFYEKQTTLKKRISEYQKQGHRLLQQKELTPSDKDTFKKNLSILASIQKSILNPGPLFIRMFLGSVNSLVLSGGPQRRYAFKKEYESFKYKFTLWNLPLSILLLFISQYRVLDTLYQVYMLYFYVTLALRECILIVNGSNIRQWWILHHYLSIVVCSVMITWVSSADYLRFRLQFMVFSVYNAALMLVQYVYQSRRLYVMTSLGKAKQMDVVSADTPQTSMLNFLIPLLFIGHAQQALLSLRLGVYAFYTSGFNADWQVYAFFLLLGIIFYGNFYTTVLVVRKKYSAWKDAEVKKQPAATTIAAKKKE